MSKSSAAHLVLRLVNANLLKRRRGFNNMYRYWWAPAKQAAEAVRTIAAAAAEYKDTPPPEPRRARLLPRAAASGELADELERLAAVLIAAAKALKDLSR